MSLFNLNLPALLEKSEKDQRILCSGKWSFNGHFYLASERVLTLTCCLGDNGSAASGTVASSEWFSAALRR